MNGRSLPLLLILDQIKNALCLVYIEVPVGSPLAALIGQSEVEFKRWEW